MIRANYHINTGTIGDKVRYNKKRKSHTQHQDRVVRTAIKDLRKGHSALCFTASQLKSIQRQVKCQYTDEGWYYRLTIEEE